MKWLKDKMNGRYGYDQLSVFLLILALIISLVAFFTKFVYINILNYIFLAIVIYRAFSKNVQKRGLENYKFMIKISPLYKWFSKKKKNSEMKKTNKIITCPNCKQKMKVPRKKGKIVVTCPKCQTKIDTKS